MCLLLDFILSKNQKQKKPEAASLQEPKALFPLACTKLLDARDDFKYFLIIGASFSASIN